MLAGLTLRPQFYPRGLNRQVHGLRGLAALMVFVFHIYVIATLSGIWPAAYVAAFDWLRVCRHGVELFFVISGYLIAGSVVRHGDAGRFLLDRCIRIYPVFLAIHLLVFGLGPVIGYKWMAGITLGGWLGDFVSNALLLPGLFDLPLAQLNAWSLSYEAGFYLTCAALHTITRHFGRRAGWAGFAVMVAPLIYLYPKASFFLVGAAIHFLKPQTAFGSPTWLRWTSPVFLAATLALLTADEVAAANVYAATVPAFFFFWCIVDGGCVVSAALRTPVLQYFGTISYSFYLWSPFVTYPIKRAILDVLPHADQSVTAIAGFALCGLVVAVAVSHLSFLWLEERAGQYLRRMTRRSGAATPIAAKAAAEGR